MSESLIKTLLHEIIFGNKIHESYITSNYINRLYKDLMLEALLYGEPISVPELRKLLRQKILNFKFIKLNGEIRDARGTLLMKYVPQSQHPKGIRPSSPKVATFYDLNKKDWRSVSQRSKEIVLSKDEETDKPIILVKDKPKGQKEPPKSFIDASANVVSVKPAFTTDEVETFYLVNKRTGAYAIKDFPIKEFLKFIKKLGKGWEVVSKEEYEQFRNRNLATKQTNIKVGDRREYINRLGKKIVIDIVNIDDEGNIYGRTLNGALFLIPEYRIKNIKNLIGKNQYETSDEDDTIIDRLSKNKDLNNIDANDVF